MKHLTLHSEAYRYAIASFKEWLQTIGYSEQTVYYLPNHVQEFLYYAESKGYAGLFQLDTGLMKEHYCQLKSRKNQRCNGGLSNAYLNKHLQALGKFIEYLRQSGRLQLPKLDIRSEENEAQVTDILTEAEVKQLYEVTYLPYEQRKHDKGLVFHEALQARDRAMLTVFYGCGLRRNEAYHLDTSDIQLEKKVVHVRRAKGYKERLVPVTQNSLQHLEHWLYDGRPYFANEKNAAFFLTYSGGRLGGQQMLLRLHTLIELTRNVELGNKDVHLHTLRHSIATHLLQRGMKLERIKEFLGHTSLESTQLYTHFVQTENGTHHASTL